MTIKVTGTVMYQDLGVGTWAVITPNQQTYELKDPPTPLRQSGLKVEIEGVIREDIMTIAMIGPVLEVKSFLVL
ncbi:MAG: hypothetical protein EA365_10145 [Gloeocapsa sp. DLM2.Bin57]|nr:MAG: hypothetical protein EA365_10145 [Gloeocapsa sp. DLM2.Bin57]